MSIPGDNKQIPDWGSPTKLGGYTDMKLAPQMNQLS